MVCRPAGNNIDFIERIEIHCIPYELFKRYAFLITCNALAHRIAYSLRLFVNLLEHKVLIAALLRSLRIPSDFKYFFVHRLSCAIADSNAVLSHYSKLSIGKNISAPCTRDDSRYIGCNKIFSITKPYDKRIILLRTDEHIRVSPAHEHKRI